MQEKNADGACILAHFHLQIPIRQFILFPMKILDRYLSQQLLGIFVMLILILSGLAWMVQILTMLKFLLSYGINLGDFLYLTSLMFPFIVSIILPFVLFIATLFVYNKMVADNEITVMTAVGMSPGRLARPALGLAIIIAALHAILTLHVVPDTQVKFYTTQWEMRYGLAHLKLQESAFTPIASGLVVFVDKVSGHDLSQLMLFDERDPKSQMTVLAEKGKLVSTARGLTIVMNNGSIQLRSDTWTVGTFDSYDMDMNVSDKNIDDQFKVRRIPTRELLYLISSEYEFSARQRKLMLAEVCNRFTTPLMDVLLVLIGMLAMLKTTLLRRRTSMAAPTAVAGMAAAMSLQMAVPNMLNSMMGVYLFAAAIIAVIAVLTWLLCKR